MPCSFFIIHKKNKKVNYAYQYLSNTETKLNTALVLSMRCFCIFNAANEYCNK